MHDEGPFMTQPASMGDPVHRHGLCNLMSVLGSGLHSGLAWDTSMSATSRQEPAPLMEASGALTNTHVQPDHAVPSVFEPPAGNELLEKSVHDSAHFA